MNVLFLDDSLGLGGKEVLLLEYLRLLDRQQFCVHLVTLTPYGVLLPEAAREADTYCLMHRRVGLDPLAIYRLRRYMLQHSINLFHANGWIDALYGLLASLGTGIKRVVTVHGYEDGWRAWVHRWTLRRFDCVVCVSQAVKQELRKSGYKAPRFAVVHNGFDPGKFFPPPMLGEHGNKQSFRLAMVGRFEQRKDHLTLIRAVGLLRSEKRRVELILIGGGEDESEWAGRELCKELGIDSAVHFLGVRRDVPQVLHQVDAFVLSSLTETFGIALVEAMACGLPVIVSDIPALLEIIGNGRHGLYFHTGDAEGLAAQVARLMDEPDLRKRCASQALARSSDFAVDKSVQALQTLYLSLADGAK